MKDLVFNAWQDLREKRLWPVALLLALALVAVPVVLLKGTPEPPPPPTVATDSDAAVPLVASDETAIAGSSKLGSFDPKDPFRSMADPPPGLEGAPGAEAAPDALAAGGEALEGDLGLETGAGSTAAGGALGDGESGSSAGGSASPSGGGSGSGSGGDGSGAGSGDSGSGGSGSGGSGSGGSGSGGSKPAPSEPAKPRYFTYAADLSFGLRGDERDLRGVEAVAPLVGRNRNVVVVYLGQSPENESVFLVNQSFRVTKGTTNCRSKCAFVYLRPERGRDEVILEGREEAGNDAGAEYRLVLRDVRRVLDDRDASARSKSAAAKRRAKAAKTRSRAKKARRTHFDFRIPMIAGQRR